MNKKLLQYLIPSTAVVAVVVGIFIFFSAKTKLDYRLNKFDLSQIPGENTIEFKTSPVPHLIFRNTETSIKKYVFSTADCGIIKHGYKNRVEQFVVFNNQGKIENIILGKNIETPELMEKMRQSGFFQRWNGKNEPCKVEYITGATYSCSAVSGGISELLNLLKHENFFK